MKILGISAFYHDSAAALVVVPGGQGAGRHRELDRAALRRRVEHQLSRDLLEVPPDHGGAEMHHLEVL